MRKSRKSRFQGPRDSWGHRLKSPGICPRTSSRGQQFVFLGNKSISFPRLVFLASILSTAPFRVIISKNIKERKCLEINKNLFKQNEWFETSRQTYQRQRCKVDERRDAWHAKTCGLDSFPPPGRVFWAIRPVHSWTVTGKTGEGSQGGSLEEEVLFTRNRRNPRRAESARKLTPSGRQCHQAVGPAKVTHWEFIV